MASEQKVPVADVEPEEKLDVFAQKLETVLKEHEKKDTIFTFGFGSNMSIRHVKHYKKMNPVSHKRGILKGYRLSFNIATSNLLDPAMANVTPVDKVNNKNNKYDSEVHGVLLELPKAEFIRLSTMEACYYPEKVKIQLYDNEKEKDCICFIATDESYCTFAKSANFAKNARLSDTSIPGENYLATLIAGAIEMKLEKEYIIHLCKNIKYASIPILDWDETQELKSLYNDVICKNNKYTMKDIIESKRSKVDKSGPLCVVRGIVFDLMHAPPFYANMLKNKDYTLPVACRCAASKDEAADIDKLSDIQMHYINGYVKQFVVPIKYGDNDIKQWLIPIGSLADNEKYNAKYYQTDKWQTHRNNDKRLSIIDIVSKDFLESNK